MSACTTDGPYTGKIVTTVMMCVVYYVVWNVVWNIVLIVVYVVGQQKIYVMRRLLYNYCHLNMGTFLYYLYFLLINYHSLYSLSVMLHIYSAPGNTLTATR